MASCIICYDLDPAKSPSHKSLDIGPAPKIKASAESGCQSCSILSRALEGLYELASVIHKFDAPWLSNQSCLITLHFPQHDHIEFCVSFEYSSRFSDLSDDSEQVSNSSSDSHGDDESVEVEADVLDDEQHSQATWSSISLPSEDGWEFYGELFSLPGESSSRCELS